MSTTITNCIFENNLAGINYTNAAGGAILYRCKDGDCTTYIEDSIFRNNTSDNQGGAIFWSEHSPIFNGN